MPEAFKLAPAAEDRAVSFTLPKEHRPYLEEYYNLRKKDGETLDAWVCRELCTVAMSNRHGTLIANNHQSHFDAEVAEGSTISDDYAAEVATL